MRYRDFDLQIVPDGPDAFMILARADSGEARAPLPHNLEECMNPAGLSSALGLYEDAFLRPPDLEVQERLIGDYLTRNLLWGEVKVLFERALEQALGAHEGLRMRWCLDPREPRLASIAALPLELLYDRRSERFYALDSRTPIVRTYDVPRRYSPRNVAGPYKVLLAGIDAFGYPPLDIEGEIKRIQSVLESRSDIRTHTLFRTNWKELRRHLLDGFDVVHLMTHGILDPMTGQGRLILDGPDGGSQSISGPELARLLLGIRPASLLVLNACQTGAGSLSNPLTSIASAAVMQGWPAVVAMTKLIADEGAIDFSEVLYDRLAAGDHLEEAMVEGRLSLDTQEESARWAIPALFLSLTADTMVLPRKTQPEPVPPRTKRDLAPPPTGLRFSMVTHVGEVESQTQIQAENVTIKTERASRPVGNSAMPNERKRDG